VTKPLTRQQRELVLSVMDLCWYEANKWTRRRLHVNGGPLYKQVLHELVAGAWDGACEAARRFRPRKGYKFSTYSTYWIFNGLQNACTEQQVLGKDWSHRDGFAKNPNLSVHSYTLGELDFAEVLGEDDPESGWGVEEWTAVRRHLNDDRAYWIVLQRYVADRTLQDVADALGVSKERVRQLEDKALRKLTRCPMLRELVGEETADAG